MVSYLSTHLASKALLTKRLELGGEHLDNVFLTTRKLGFFVVENECKGKGRLVEML